MIPKAGHKPIERQMTPLAYRDSSDLVSSRESAERIWLVYRPFEVILLRMLGAHHPAFQLGVLRILHDRWLL
jgi:hypothetical protein